MGLTFGESVALVAPEPDVSCFSNFDDESCDPIGLCDVCVLRTEDDSAIILAQDEFL